MSVTLILGGRRSGKSEFAEHCAEAMAASGLYVATAAAHDAEMADRIRRHQDRRGAFWTAREEQLDLAPILADTGPDQVILIECLTLWVSNLMLAQRNIVAESQILLTSLSAVPYPVVLVSNEVGLGIIPDNALARQFGDYAGRLNQQVALIADTVVFVAAGLPLVLKGTL